MKNVKTPSLWELIQIDALEKKKMQSDKKLNKCNQCEHGLCASEKHIRSPSGEKSFKCNQCDYASSQVSSLSTHLKTHSGEKSNKCNQCDYASSREDNLRRHLKRHIIGETSNNWNNLTQTQCRSWEQYTKKWDNIVIVLAFRWFDFWPKLVFFFLKLHYIRKCNQVKNFFNHDFPFLPVLLLISNLQLFLGIYFWCDWVHF